MFKYLLASLILLIVGLATFGFLYFKKALPNSKTYDQSSLDQKNSPSTPHQTTQSLFVQPLNKIRNENYLIGSWYFAGWWSNPPSHYNHAKADWRSSYPDREPLIGWFDDNQKAMDEEIRQAHSGGLDFFAFDWYTDRDSIEYPGSRENINNGLKFFLTSSNKSLMKFALLYVNTDGQTQFEVITESEWSQVTDKWVSYFKDPQYLKIDNKPVLIVISAGGMHSQWGGKEGVLKALSKLRSKAKVAGFPGVYVGGSLNDLGKNGENPKKYAEEGYDFFIGGYASHGDIGLDSQPYNFLFSWAPNFWNQFTSNSPLPFVPTVSVGWDRRPVVYKPEGYLTDKSPEKFGQLLKLAKDFNDSHNQKMVMIYAWNEIGEGGILMPTKADGYSYLNQILKIF